MRVRRISIVGLVVGLVLALSTVLPPAARAQSYGDLSFPDDEHAKVDGLDYWWGAADIVTTVGNHYTVSMAYTGFSSYAVAGHQLWAHQGPYEGLSVLSENGPAEWGHPGQAVGEFLTTLSTHVPGVTERRGYHGPLPRFRRLD